MRITPRVFFTKIQKRMIARRTCFVLEDESGVGGVQVEHVVGGGARERPNGRLNAKIRHRERVGHVP
jgi:hypothetical protein